MNVRPVGIALLLMAVSLAWLSTPVVSYAQEADAHAEEGDHGEGHGDPNPLGFDPDLALFTGIVFLVLFTVLSVFAWPQISAALLERERLIENNIAEAAAKHEEAKQLLVQYEAKLASAANEVRGLLDEARRDAEHTKSEIIAEAKKAADAERDRALLDVERAAEAAMKNIGETIANQAVDLAGKVVRRNLSPEQHTQLVRDALSTLASGQN